MRNANVRNDLKLVPIFRRILQLFLERFQVGKMICLYIYISLFGEKHYEIQVIKPFEMNDQVVHDYPTDLCSLAKTCAHAKSL